MVLNTKQRQREASEPKGAGRGVATNRSQASRAASSQEPKIAANRMAGQSTFDGEAPPSVSTCSI